ncbi:MULTISPECIES: outer membrane protein assembly factor BamB family protein [unclassified Corallococcus]|uniref:outer membrane protein assembly factor BamB family protein n=1 Tax=unclassified Corallococcus TaxID=2685029 RepID=UPI001F5C9213|nr:MULTISPECIES: PQQ-binding-like beta-propeller repeat protein [unclassified Corallococcus]WAS88491.1 PQQ-binding-like beta-propeller repeat protein [Corallococcus sp. NCRR]
MTLAVMACQRSPVEAAFRYSSDASSRTGLTALQDGVLLGNEAGKVVRLDREGRPVWTARLDREVAVAPALAAESVVVGTVVGEVACLSLTDGKERWRLGGEPPVLTPPVVDDAGHSVFLVAPDGAVRALAVDSGQERWKRPAPRASTAAESLEPLPSVAPGVRPAPVLVGDVLVVPLGSGLWALDARSGEPRWSRPVTDVVGLDSERDTVFVATRPGQVLALSVKDGSTRWEQRFADGVTGPPARALGALWVGAGPSSLVGLSTSEGREVARVALPSPLVGRVQVGLEDLLLVPTSGHEGQLVALKAPGWTPAFTVRADTPLRTRPVVRGPLVFVLGLDGRVLAWRLRVPPPR